MWAPSGRSPRPSRDRFFEFAQQLGTLEERFVEAQGGGRAQLVFPRMWPETKAKVDVASEVSQGEQTHCGRGQRSRSERVGSRGRRFGRPLSV